MSNIPIIHKALALPSPLTEDHAGIWLIKPELSSKFTIWVVTEVGGVWTAIEQDSGPTGLFEQDITVALTNGKTIGKYTNGQTIPAVGKTAEEVIRDIAIEYLTPSFTAFSMSGQTTTIEVGTIISGDKNFTFAFQYPDNVNANSISIIDVTNSNTVLASGLSKTSPVSAPVGSVTKTGVSTHQWRGRAMNSNSVSFDSGNFTVNWQFRYFRGSVANFPADGDALRTSLLGDSIISNSNSMSFTTGTTNNKFVIAIPSHKTLVEAKNTGTNENLPFVLSGGITQVPDAGGTDRAYKVYTLETGVPFGSNYTINITLS